VGFLSGNHSNASNRRLTAYSNGSVTVEAETDV
jgi:hypothetical protein